MNNKIFIKKLLIINSFFLIFLLILSCFLHNKYSKDGLLDKEYLVKKYSPKIIFAGDSRANHQLNVKVAQEFLGLKDGDIINIAVNSADPIMLNNLIDKYPEKFKDKVLILSMSANQMNDNQKDIGYFSFAMISKLDFKTQLKTFIPGETKTLIKFYTENFKSLFYIKNRNFSEVTYGFSPIHKVLNLNDVRIDRLILNPWYKNYSDGGLKFQLISDALKELKSKVGTLYIYTAPFSPTYLKVVNNHALLEHELSFKEKLKEICEIEKIVCINYLKNEELKDEHFYDVSHLNIEGSKIFTKKVLEDFKIEEKVKND